MGHSHSSTHKRLRSISSMRNCGEFTEVVDLEFSDAGMFSDPPAPKNPQETTANDVNLSKKEMEQNNITGKEQLSALTHLQYPKDLLLLETQVAELDEKVNKLSPEELFVYFPSLKDDLHNCWQKVYSIKEENSQTKLKKHQIIDHIRELLRLLNARLQRRQFRQ